MFHIVAGRLDTRGGVLDIWRYGYVDETRVGFIRFILEPLLVLSRSRSRFYPGAALGFIQEPLLVKVRAALGFIQEPL